MYLIQGEGGRREANIIINKTILIFVKKILKLGPEIQI